MRHTKPRPLCYFVSTNCTPLCLTRCEPRDGAVSERRRAKLVLFCQRLGYDTGFSSVRRPCVSQHIIDAPVRATLVRSRQALRSTRGTTSTISGCRLSEFQPICRPRPLHAARPWCDRPWLTLHQVTQNCLLSFAIVVLYVVGAFRCVDSAHNSRIAPQATPETREDACADRKHGNPLGDLSSTVRVEQQQHEH